MAARRLSNVFIAVCVLFCFYVLSISLFGNVFRFMAVANAIAFVLFLLYFVTYSVDYTGKAKVDKRVIMALAVMFVATVLSEEAFILGITLPYSQGFMLEGTFLYVLLLTIAVYLISAGQFAKKYNKKLYYVMLAAAIAIVLVMLASKITLKGIIPNDEVFLGYKAAGVLISGKNPYTASFVQQLESNILSGNVSSSTATMENTIDGKTSYPPLYILSFVPYYLMNNWVRGLSQYIILEIAAFTALLLLVIAWCIGLNRHGKLVYGFAIIFAFFVSHILSTVLILLLAVLIIAYVKLDKWYAGIMLGIAASMQQLSWVLVLFLMLWSFRESKKTGFRNLSYAMLTFMAINIYFIALGPYSYFGAVFFPVSGRLFPNSASQLGFLLAEYGIRASSFSAIFYISMAVSAMLFIYVDVKELAGLFAMLPFALLGFGQASYYLFFLAFAIAGLYAFKKRGARKPVPFRNALPYAMAIAVILVASLAYASHVSYEHNVGLHAFEYNTTVSGNHTVYNASFSTKGNVHTLYVFFVVYSGYTGVSSYGPASNFTTINVNNGSASMSVKIPEGNSAYTCVIYNANYLYICPTARVG